MMVADELLELVALAYEAGAEPERWPALLARLGDRLGDRTSALQVHDLARSVGSFAYGYRVDPDATRAYDTHYAALNPWTLRGAPQMRPGAVLVGEQALSVRELRRTEFHADFLRPYDIEHSLAAVIARDDETAAFVTVQRSGAMGEFDDDELRLVSALVPHLQRALALHRRLGAARDVGQSLIDVAERARWGVVFLDRERRVVFANAAARALDRSTFAQVLTRAAAGGGAVTRDGRPPLAISVSQLRGGRDVLGLSAAALAIFIVDPEHQPPSPERVLREAYRLTSTEARLALALSRGDTLEDVADATRTSVGTQRTHLKRVLAKTGTRRQAQLIRLVLLLSPPGA